MRSTIVHALAPLAAAASIALLGAPAAYAQPADPGDPFRRGGWHLELGGHAALETWNYNTSHETMAGIRPGVAYGLRDGLTLVAGGPLYYVAQRGVDGWLFGVTGGIRGRIYRRQRLSVFVEFEVGISESDTFVPPRGTRFNYLALGGAGATFRLRDGAHLLTGLKWVHVSNNSLAGRHRNPDIEAVGLQAAVIVGF